MASKRKLDESPSTSNSDNKEEEALKRFTALQLKLAEFAHVGYRCAVDHKIDKTEIYCRSYNGFGKCVDELIEILDQVIYFDGKSVTKYIKDP